MLDEEKRILSQVRLEKAKENLSARKRNQKALLKKRMSLYKQLKII